MSKTISQLTLIPTNNNVKALTDITSYTRESIESFKKLFTLDDCIAVSHKVAETDDGYVTYRIPVSKIEAGMYESRKNSISSEISSALSLKELAWKEKSDLGLGDLAYRSKISYLDIVNPDDVPTGKGRHQSVIPLTVIDSDWGNLRSMNKDDLKLSALAHRQYIDDTCLSGKSLTLEHSVSGYGGLALSDEVDLELSALAHRDKINLRADYGLYLEGNLSFEHVDEYRTTLDELYKLSAASSASLGGVKIGYNNSFDKANYPLQLNAQSKAYTRVPWTDSRFSVKSLSATSPTTKNNTIDISLKYSTIVYTPLSTAVEKETILNTSATIKPYIYNNVVAVNDIGLENYSSIENSIALFSKDNSTDKVQIKNSSAKINPQSTDKKYLREDGTWDEITLATTTKDGLLKARDKQLIDYLRTKGDIFYTLPKASSTILGGIKLGTDVVAQGQMTLYTGEEVVSLPLRMNSSNQAFVNIPKSLGESGSFDNKVDKAVDGKITDMLNKLYPVGAIYITTAAICPLESPVIPNSVWTQIKGRYLLASGQLAGTTETYTAEQGKTKTVDPGLPSHAHNYSFGFSSGNSREGYPQHGGRSQCAHSSYQFSTDSTSTAIYGKSKTVRPPAFVVNVFMRTA